MVNDFRELLAVVIYCSHLLAKVIARTALLLVACCWFPFLARSLGVILGHKPCKPAPNASRAARFACVAGFFCFCPLRRSSRPSLPAALPKRKRHSSRVNRAANYVCRGSRLRLTLLSMA